MNELKSYKLSGYKAAYDLELADLNVRCLLEIGIAGGGSHEAWAVKYPSATIVGVDKDERCLGLKLQHPAIRVFCGDISSPAFVRSFTSQVPLFDVVIDDGSHWPHHQIRAFELLWPRLSSPGVYVIEDLCTRYAPFWRHRNYRGDVMKLLQNIVDQMNSYNKHPRLGHLTGRVSHVTHYDSIVFIHKADTPMQYEVVTGSVDCRELNY